MNKVFIQTYGCQMNVADSEEMFAQLAARGAVLTEQLDEADIVLINTCTVRDHAEHRAVSFLGRLASWKKEKPGRKIIFAGCAAQRLGNALQKKYPFLDILSGAKDIEHFSDTLSALLLSHCQPPRTSTRHLSQTLRTMYLPICRCILPVC